MDNIEHVVVLMLENRSFDSMLGWLYEHDTPALNIPPAAPGQSEQLAGFGERAASAPTFEQVLTLAQPRTDEAALPFLDTPHAIGDPVGYGDSLSAEKPEQPVPEFLPHHHEGGRRSFDHTEFCHVDLRGSRCRRLFSHCERLAARRAFLRHPSRGPAGPDK
jgi:hypothetical protein